MRLNYSLMEASTPNAHIELYDLLAKGIIPKNVYDKAYKIVCELWDYNPVISPYLDDSPSHFLYIRLKSFDGVDTSIMLNW